MSNKRNALGCIDLVHPFDLQNNDAMYTSHNISNNHVFHSQDISLHYLISLKKQGFWRYDFAPLLHFLHSSI